MQLGKYRHFKGNVYEVFAVATHTETEEQLVIYKNPEGRIFARPYDLFNEEVPEGKENSTGQKYRFEALLKV